MIRRVAMWWLAPMLAGGALLAVTACATTPASAGPAAPEPWQGAARCRFVAPTSLGMAQVEWIGACRAGKADGLGMLRPRGAGAADIAFYGRVVAGLPDLGIIDLPSGFKAGRLHAGDIVTGSDMDERDSAFEVAAQAATAVSRHYQSQGNAASARYYAQKAKVFLTQIE